MDRIEQLISNLNALADEMPRLLAESLQGSENEIMATQREQLLQGLRSDGKPITPSYLEDKFFKSPESARRYAEWKRNFMPRTQRDLETPNLYINGRFHDELGCLVSGTIITIAGDSPYSSGIVAKYGLDTFGLTDDNWREVIVGKDSQVMPKFINKIIDFILP